MKIFQTIWNCKDHRKEYKINPTIKLFVDKEDFSISFLPTIVWQPWVSRFPDQDGVVDIWWLNIHILIGKWVRKK